MGYRENNVRTGFINKRGLIMAGCSRWHWNTGSRHQIHNLIYNGISFLPKYPLPRLGVHPAGFLMEGTWTELRFLSYFRLIIPVGGISFIGILLIRSPPNTSSLAPAEDVEAGSSTAARRIRWVHCKSHRGFCLSSLSAEGVTSWCPISLDIATFCGVSPSSPYHYGIAADGRIWRGL